MYRKLFFILNLFIISAFNLSAEIIGDSIVVLYNNWNINDEACYEAYSRRIKIQGNDSIVESESTMSTQIKLTDILSNGDLLFETRIQLPDLGPLGAKESLRRYYERIYKFLETPQVLRTDSLGVPKELYNIEELRELMDSCVMDLSKWVMTLDIPFETQNTLIDGARNSFKQSLSRENLSENGGFFQLYGSMYELGMKASDVKMPIPFFNNQEVDANVTLTCEIVSQDDSCEIVSLKTYTIYDSDQLMELVTQLLPADKLKESGFLNPNRPFISITESEEYLIDVLSGTILQIESEKKSIMPNAGRIDYSIMQIIN